MIGSYKGHKIKTCDGVSSNRKFIHLHGSEKQKKMHIKDQPKPLYDWDNITYKTLADEDRPPIFFISDPPHLIKCVRNCWSNSYGHNWTRNMYVSECMLYFVVIPTLTFIDEWAEHKLETFCGLVPKSLPQWNTGTITYTKDQVGACKANILL